MKFFLKKTTTSKTHLFLSQIFSTIAFTIAFASASNAEEFNMNNMPPPDMYMQYSAGALKTGSSLSVDITVPENWHVNANIAADEFLKPSSIDVSAQGIRFGAPKWPEPIKEYSEALDLENLVFKGTFTVELPIDSVESNYDSLTTAVTFHYQACDNSICLAPSQKTIKISEQGFGGSKATNSSEIKKNEGEVTSEPTSSDTGTLALLFFAFLGGIILNLMPCVLPVLSLKLFSLIKQASESRGRLLVLGLSTTTGILASFWVLAAIVSILKIGGSNAGWGMQFQSAGFIAFMVVILSAFAMSFFGVFEVWLPGHALTQMDAAGRKQGIGGAFFTGALLVLLSTPCSAPFLGTAMGFAFTAPIPILFLFFTAAGAGLALPYLLVSFFPSILKVFPKPGLWMVHLQKVMGVLLLATVAWLLWVVNEQAGSVGTIIFAIIAILSIIASFVIGKFAPPGSSFNKELAGFAIASAVLVFFWFSFASPNYEKEITARFEARAKEQMTEDGWYRYTPELIENFAKTGRTVFIDATADWCLTCKANEAAVLSRPDFLQAMDSLKVARVKADWTRETPEVAKLLKSMGKSGVPAYAIYPKGDAGKQIVLPELLTTNAIVKLIK